MRKLTNYKEGDYCIILVDNLGGTFCPVKWLDFGFIVLSCGNKQDKILHEAKNISEQGVMVGVYSFNKDEFTPICYFVESELFQVSDNQGHITEKEK